jgi:FkbM family methyltransferase
MKKKSFLKQIYQALPLKKQVFQLVRTVYTPPQSVYKHLFFNGKFEVKIDNNHSFYMNQYNTHGYSIEDDMFWLGLTHNNREKQSIDLWQKLSAKSDVIFDIGANTGLFSLLSKSVNPKSQVYGFEPIDRTFQKYAANCRVNNYDVHCEPIALSDKTGVSYIYDLPVENLYSATLNQNFSDNHHDKVGQIKTSIATKTLADYIEEKGIKRIDLMKIDVEMHEPEVLEGMKGYLKAFQPTILIEILGDEIGAKVQKLLSCVDYLFFNLDEKTQPRQVKAITKSESYNYLICRKEVAADLGLI